VWCRRRRFLAKKVEKKTNKIDKKTNQEEEEKK
jgi:hypothetical protein